MGIQDLLRNHPAIGGLVGGLAIGGGIVNIFGRLRSRRKKTKRKASTATRRRKSRKTSSKKARRTGRSSRASARSSRKRIRMTKHGQPFIILASGKARFISKKSARIMRKRKGGFS